MLKALSAAGFSSIAAHRLTVEDVRAAVSDQVPISLDTEGENTVMVDADWYDRLVHARDVFENVERRWTGRSERDPNNDVLGFWLSAGKGNDNPHIILSIDRDSESKVEARGRIPEERGGIRIEVEEAPREEELMCEDKIHPYASNYMPGGLRVTFHGPRESASGSLCPRTLEGASSDVNYNYSLSTNAHVVADAHGMCGSDLIGATAYHGSTPIGQVVAINHDHDMAIIHHSDDNWATPENKVWLPDDHSARMKVSYTAGRDRVDYFINQETLVKKYGIGSCRTAGQIHAKGKKESTREYTFLTGDAACNDYWYDCVRWGTINTMEPGDSGSLLFGLDPDADSFDDGTRYGICCNSWRWYDYSAGPAGYAWRDKHGYWWQKD